MITNNKIKKLLTAAPFLFVGIFSFTVSVFAWTAPTAPPPGGNIGAPINISTNTQTFFGSKIFNISNNANGTPGVWFFNGGFGVGGLFSAEDAIFDGDVEATKFCLGTRCIANWDELGTGGGTGGGTCNNNGTCDIGETAASCPVDCGSSVNLGTCGPVDGTTVSAAPVTELCLVGASSAVIGSGPWTWDCVGTNSTANCSAQKTTTLVNGSCGTEIDTCVAGNFTDRADSESNYRWYCAGLNGGTRASCSLPIEGGGGGGNQPTSWGNAKVSYFSPNSQTNVNNAESVVNIKTPYDAEFYVLTGDTYTGNVGVQAPENWPTEFGTSWTAEAFADSVTGGGNIRVNWDNAASVLPLGTFTFYICPGSCSATNLSNPLTVAITSGGILPPSAQAWSVTPLSLSVVQGNTYDLIIPNIAVGTKVFALPIKTIINGVTTTTGFAPAEWSTVTVAGKVTSPQVTSAVGSYTAKFGPTLSGPWSGDVTVAVSAADGMIISVSPSQVFVNQGYAINLSGTGAGYSEDVDILSVSGPSGTNAITENWARATNGIINTSGAATVGTYVFKLRKASIFGCFGLCEDPWSSNSATIVVLPQQPLAPASSVGQWNVSVPATVVQGNTYPVGINVPRNVASGTRADAFLVSGPGGASGLASNWGTGVVARTVAGVVASQTITSPSTTGSLVGNYSVKFCEAGKCNPNGTDMGAQYRKWSNQATVNVSSAAVAEAVWNISLPSAVVKGSSYNLTGIPTTYSGPVYVKACNVPSGSVTCTPPSGTGVRWPNNSATVTAGSGRLSSGTVSSNPGIICAVFGPTASGFASGVWSNRDCIVVTAASTGTGTGTGGGTTGGTTITVGGVNVTSCVTNNGAQSSGRISCCNSAFPAPITDAVFNNRQTCYNK